MIDRHIIEPTGDGIIINWRRSQIDGRWIKVPYTIEQAEGAMKIWAANAAGRQIQVIEDMRAAIELERENQGSDT